MTSPISEPQFLSPDQLDRLLFAIKQMSVSVASLQELPQLGQLVANKHSQWAHLFSERHCFPGEVICRECEPGDSMYIIQSGRAGVIKGDLSNPVILDCHQRGESIGEMALLEGSPRSATVVALEDVHLHEINREKFFKLLRASDTFSQDIMRLLSARLRDTSEAVQRETMQKIRDPLTGLYNRYYLRSVFDHELQRAERAQYPVCVILMDVDHFKKVNDTYGHQAGDQVLRSLGALIHSQVRRADVACRYGGEEFLIVQPEAPLKVAVARAETIRTRFDTLQIEYAGNALHRTLSVGVACFPDHGTTTETLIRAADQALYTAKANGRNQVVAAEKA